jgi:hypothetical protein
MKRETDPSRLLHDLLDRLERRADHTRRITARPSQAFASTDARDHLVATLTRARDAGTIAVEWDRDAPHLIARVVLRDAEALYRHLGRTPAADQRSAAIGGLGAFQPHTDVGRELQNEMVRDWAAGKTYLGLAPTATDDALKLIRVADAAFTVFEGGPLPLRTRSARLLGDSKAMERMLPKFLAFLKLKGRLDPRLTRDEALTFLGLAKFPQPVLIAGPIAVNGVNAAELTYLGLPPEAIADAALTGSVRSILTIENLESFHRHVRECREDGDVVIYCGGFPAQGVLGALRHIADLAGVAKLYHWGDIDVGGIRIGRFLETSLPYAILPHLMTPALATALGRKATPAKELSNFPAESAFSALACFLASDDAHWLEQEVLDPKSV